MSDYIIATCKSRLNKTVKHHNITWQQLVKRLRKEKRTDETFEEFCAMSADQKGNIKDVGAFIGGKFKGDQRKGTELEMRTLLTLDLDHVPKERLATLERRFSNYTYVLYSTHSHCADAPRLRLVLPFEKPVSVARYEPIARRFAEFVGINMFDDTTYQPSRIMYWPSAAADGEVIFRENYGSDIYPRDFSWLEMDDPTTWPRSKREKNPRTHVNGTGLVLDDPGDKHGAVGEFCRAYGIEEAMQEFIPDAYESAGQDRYTYIGGSTYGGAVCYENTWLYSHHESDPCFSQNCNAFDLVRIHKFGELDADSDGEVEGTQLPSYKAMVTLVGRDETIQAERLAAISEEFEDNEEIGSARTRERPNESEVTDKSKKADPGTKKRPGGTPDETTLKGYLRRYVHIIEDDLICDLKMPASRCIFKRRDWVAGYANNRVLVPAPTARDPDNMKEVPLSTLWLTSEKKVKVVGLRYAPETLDRVVIDPRTALLDVNQFHMPYPRDDAVNMAGKPVDLKPFFKHMKYLFPIPIEMDWMLDFMAFSLQRPSERCKVVPLHISRATGTGRGWLLEAIGAVLGDWNCKKTTIESMISTNGSSVYHDAFHKSIFIGIEEVRQPSGRYEVNDQMKDLLEASRLQLNLKYGAQGMFDIYANIFMMSNHRDALILQRGDRRILVLTGPDKQKKNSYYKKLYNWIRTPENVAALAGHLWNRDLSKFNYIRSFETPARRAMIEMNKSVTEQLFDEFVENPPADYMTSRQIYDHINLLGQHEEDVSEKQISKLLGQRFDHANGGKTIRFKGAVTTVWKLVSGPELGLDAIKEQVNTLTVGK